VNTEDVVLVLVLQDIITELLHGFINDAVDFLAGTGVPPEWLCVDEWFAEFGGHGVAQFEFLKVNLVYTLC